ncbi:MAG: NAD-dependent epimerase/dehydratase family protein [Candidatus Aminicenantaceae bacterium]
MKALVTGSCGFIGSHLTEELLRRGYKVHVLLRKKSDLKWIRRLNTRPVMGDYSRPESLHSSVAGMDFIFHLAAVLHAPDWKTYYRVNTMGTRHLLQACAEVNPEMKKFVFVSTIAAAGPVFYKVFRDESHFSRPDSSYGKSKLLAEKEVMNFQNRIPVTIARPPNVLGIRQRELLLVLKLLKKRFFPLLGNNDPQTSLCFVQDLVEALILMAEKEQARSRMYYITDGKGYSWKNMLETISRLLDVYPLTVKLPYPLLLAAARLSEIYAGTAGKDPLISPRYIISSRYHYHLYRNGKIRRDLGFTAKIPFIQGMENIIRWYEQKGVL